MQPYLALLYLTPLGLDLSLEPVCQILTVVRGSCQRPEVGAVASQMDQR